MLKGEREAGNELKGEREQARAEQRAERGKGGGTQAGRVTTGADSSGEG